MNFLMLFYIPKPLNLENLENLENPASFYSISTRMSTFFS